MLSIIRIAIIEVILFTLQAVIPLWLCGQENMTTPNYSIIFPQDKVNRIDITIKAGDWKKLTDQLTTKFGKPNNGFFPGPPPEMMRDSMKRPWEGDSLRMPADGPGSMGEMRRPPWGADSAGRMRMPQPDFKGGRPPFPGGKMGPPRGMRPPTSFDTVPDIFVPATIAFAGKQWHNVGFRFKGNSSLMMTWSRGIKKIPFRLNFSKLGDSIPEVKGQKCFGFKELTFSNNISDNSFLHEKMASDLFREGGIKAPHTAFYEVYVDNGEGAQYFGLYTAIEIVEDAMLKDQFGNNKGNCYKPDGQAGSFAAGMFDKKSFEKKTNKKDADYSDILKLYKVINSATRTSDAKLWKIQLDSIFDIPVFIKWLAINSVIQNWDTYGLMPHNYYLYNNPATKKLTWIPWDNNEALSSGRREQTSLSLSEITNEWPLIRNLLDQPEYNELYHAEIKKFITETFNPNQVKGKIEKYYQLIYPYAVAEKKGYTFQLSTKSINEAKNELLKHIDKRYQAATDFLNKK
jgi:spore coat protein H